VAVETPRMLVVDKAWVKNNIGMFRQRKAVIITGAGISVASGIPDFRSKTGIFNDIKEVLKINGTDLFTYKFSVDKETRKTYLGYISKLKLLVEEAEPSYTHRFLKRYSEACKRLRIYTQNVDGLEERAGLECTSGRETSLVYLHGNMRKLICLYCGHKIAFTEEERRSFERGEEIVCSNCLKRNEKRREGQRQLPVGMFHTTIIHYHQIHPDSALISRMMDADGSCDLLIVMGTSLRIHGVKKLARHFCRLNGVFGRRIYVNLEAPTREFAELFDFMWKDKCDEFCEVLGEELGLGSVTESVQRLSIASAEESKGPEKNEPEAVSEAKGGAATPEEVSYSRAARRRKRKEERKMLRNRMAKLSLDGNLPMKERLSLNAREERPPAAGEEERRMLELFSHKASPNTPKKKLSFIAENVEEEVQSYIDMLLRSSQERSKRDAPSRKKKADRSVQEDEILQCMKSKNKKLNPGEGKATRKASVASVICSKVNNKKK
jgi:NAD+-dependent protein deacetylase SIR2